MVAILYDTLLRHVSINDSAFKVDGQRGGVYVGKAGDARGTKQVSLVSAASVEGITGLVPGRGGSSSVSSNEGPSGGPPDDSSTREALKFFFSNDGRLVREFVLEEVCNTVDALSRDATRELLISLGRSWMATLFLFCTCIHANPASTPHFLYPQY